MTDGVQITFQEADYERIHALEMSVRYLARVVQSLCLSTNNVSAYDLIYSWTESDEKAPNVVSLNPRGQDSVARTTALARKILAPIDIDRHLGRTPRP